MVKKYLMEKVCGVIAMISLEMLSIFGVNNTPSSHIDNLKNNFLISGEGTIKYIDDSVGAAEIKFSINFSS